MTSEPPPSDPEPIPAQSDPEPIFTEPGASWLWVLLGPIAAGAMILVQRGAGVGFQPLVPLMFLVLVSGVLTIQVKAARIHTSVELTRDALREGTETILISEIVTVFPESAESPKSSKPPHSWQSARTLGELSGIPKGRYAIGLKLTNGRTAQAWARDDDTLRAALTELVGQREAG
ncbi:MAG TPA: DUF3093 domain-containing protein [Mycobacterium sp.]|nr:DUF3093 domain-containing protein [Mycobacterium sp.]HPZ94468.1 DUF3093 domain-containing protein [Mycobacterium sp.]HQE16692.1 DUF3093 domain-containing protein [Mycobacterium sp.]